MLTVSLPRLLTCKVNITHAYHSRAISTPNCLIIFFLQFPMDQDAILCADLKCWSDETDILFVGGGGGDNLREATCTLACHFFFFFLNMVSNHAISV